VDFIVVIMLVDFHVHTTSQMNRLVKAICYARLLYPNLHLQAVERFGAHLFNFKSIWPVTIVLHMNTNCSIPKHILLAMS